MEKRAVSSVVLGIPMEDIVREINERSKAKKIKNPKQCLTLLRNFSIYCNLNTKMPNEQIMAALVAIAKEAGDQDPERKIVRICYSFMSSFVLQNGVSSSLSSDFFNFLKEEIKTSTGSRLSLAWRQAGLLSSHCGASVITDNAANVAQVLKRLEYPTKSKASMWGGQKKVEKDFESTLFLSP